MANSPIKIPVRWVIVNLVGALFVAFGLTLLQTNLGIRPLGYFAFSAGAGLVGLSLFQILRKAHKP